MTDTEFTPIDYLLIGHATADIVPDGRVLGGTVSYGAGTAHAFGYKAGIVTSSAISEPLLDDIKKYAQIASVPAENTSTFENVYGDDGLSRTQYIRSVASPITIKDVPKAWLSASLVLVGPLTNEVDPQIVHAFSNATVVVTPQGWFRRWDDDGRVHFKRWFDPDILNAIDVIVFSEEDIIEAPEIEQEMVDLGGHVIVTRADKGGTHYYKGKATTYEAISTQVVHATGAGDIFASSLLATLPKLNHNMQHAIQVASMLASYSITRTALDSVPKSHEIESTLARVRASL